MKRAKYFITVLSVFFLFFLYTQVYAGWSREKLISQWGNRWYPQIIAKNDTLHVVYSKGTGSDMVCYIRSTDGGLTWTLPRVLSDTTYSTAACFPKIAIFNSKIIVLWRDIAHQGVNRYNIGYSISYNRGLSWTNPYYVLEHNRGSIQYFTAAGCDSIIQVVIADAYTLPIRFYNVKSTDFGQSWSEAEYMFDANELGKMDMVAYDDTFHYTWEGNFEDGDRWETYYTRITDDGPILPVNEPLTLIDDHNSYWSSIAVNEHGHLAFCCVDFRYSQYFAQGDLFIRFSYDGGNNWTDERQIYFLHHAGGYTGLFFQGDTIHVAWEDLRFDQWDIFYFKSPCDEYMWYNRCMDYRIEKNPGDAHSPSITVSNSKVYLVWSDFRYDPNRYIYPGIYFSSYKEKEDIIGQEGIEAPHVRPNPFNSQTMITLNHVKGGEACLEIYDITGRLVKKLQQGVETNGRVNFVWDATDNSGNKVSSGVYFAKVLAPQNTKAVKLLYLK